ncbi:hypothetical protein CsSME_00045517 [Camellia sinensis var. sinensis]|uniref:G-patch domain-containing protein n=1 Tax=Camellia sinensis var. sinensis TaxID=542762 RepID=A0A4S4E2J1_CAMSN|nr:hypothetical protein TEA_022479 [Camellia sinensis var. sinensis]
MAETTNKEPSNEEEEEDYMGDLSQFLPLETTAPSKSLVQMGYTPGSTLGKEGSGLAEPVGLEIRWTRAGIGQEDPRKKKRKREDERMEWEREKEEALMEDFGCRHKEQWQSRRIVVNYHKVKATLEQLENKEVVAEADKDEKDAEYEEKEEEITTEEELHGTRNLELGRLQQATLNFE